MGGAGGAADSVPSKFPWPDPNATTLPYNTGYGMGGAGGHGGNMSIQNIIGNGMAAPGAGMGGSGAAGAQSTYTLSEWYDLRSAPPAGAAASAAYSPGDELEEGELNGLGNDSLGDE